MWPLGKGGADWLTVGCSGQPYRSGVGLLNTEGGDFFYMSGGNISGLKSCWVNWGVVVAVSPGC